MDIIIIIIISNIIMGCKSTKPDGFNIETEYRNKNLPMPDKSLFQSEFEIEAFMTINILRADPRILIHHIKEVKGRCCEKLIIGYREQTVQGQEVGPAREGAREDGRKRVADHFFR